MELRVGSSGFSYAFWKGSFYPADIDAEQMLAYYAARFDTVEINNTFYRMPKTEVLRRWSEAVPDSFRFAIKASRRITHLSRLKETGDNTAYLFRQLEALGDKLGCVLFQCPPNLRKDVPRLQTFLESLPAGCPAVMEFRHATWFDDEVYEVLAARRVVLCASDEDQPDPPLRATAAHGYVRLREPEYDDAGLQHWLTRISAMWPAAYVFFKHEETAPVAIERMLRLTRAVPAPIG